MLEEDLLEEIEEAEEATRRILMPTLEGISPMSGSKRLFLFLYLL